MEDIRGDLTQGGQPGEPGYGICSALIFRDSAAGMTDVVWPREDLKTS